MTSMLILTKNLKQSEMDGCSTFFIVITELKTAGYKDCHRELKANQI